jgi:acyl-coenzyme A thioesterase PaaI-like protein
MTFVFRPSRVKNEAGGTRRQARVGPPAFDKAQAGGVSFVMPYDDPTDAVARLAESVRRLIDVTVTIDAPPALLADAAARVDALVAALRPAVPDAPPARYPDGGGATAAAFFPYDCVMGARNPLAAPVDIEWHDPLAIGTATFSTAYEGPPGCVHGAVIAATFDQVLNVANLMSGAAGPTARLEMRYRQPTPLRRRVRFEGWVTRREARKIHSAGRLLVDDTVTVEAEGLYIVVDVERVMRMLDP